MTIIVAFQGEKNNWIGSDSHSVEGMFLAEAGSKVLDMGKYYVGFAGSYRVADLIRENSVFPGTMRSIKDLRKFREALQILIQLNTMGLEAEDLCSSSLLICSPYGLATMELGDYQIHWIKSGYYAIGAGRDVASGALAASRAHMIDGRTAINTALSVTINHIAFCGGKKHIYSLPRLK